MNSEFKSRTKDLCEVSDILSEIEEFLRDD